MLDSKGDPIEPGDVKPRGMCQPPVKAMALIERLSPREMRRALQVAAIWAPEVFEKGLLRVSEERAIADEWERERAAGGEL